MRKGDRVEILIHAGLVEGSNSSRFFGECQPGTVGEYVGSHPNKKLKGWHLVRVGELLAPLAESQFRKVE